jgi:hypothetical protein
VENVQELTGKLRGVVAMKRNGVKEKRAVR